MSPTVSPARIKATFRAAVEAWLRVHEIEETTRQGYESYARLYLYPAFGDEPVGKITARLLEVDFVRELVREPPDPVHDLASSIIEFCYGGCGGDAVRYLAEVLVATGFGRD